MAFKETTTIPYTPKQVFSGLTNRDFHVYAADAFRADLDEFSVMPHEPTSDDTVSVNIQRTVNGEDFANKLPSAVQRFAKGRVAIEQTEAWSAAADDGARDANATIKVPMAKATATATIKLYPTEDGSGTVVETEGSVKSTIPLMGSKIAQLAEPQVGKFLNGLTKKLEAWLKEH
ncbi:MAG: DUF2505 domain-containing protein [Yaniella sp.]|uniref:DUF2505 domain-containing protein n=1 Tax=Yaniella sp. TaxID=2773929 RepID=UPI0026490634|nr:DUF2505 domain-containing protein [Yaniella sp.]MDN5704152.1 DUF2505 domain-containing protein [Yaniella sp.]MDN5730825.1 DUF2505 domain-containing protein [Yaniella sp.]MDN5814704.1 DUF2505 domain-containing protein [Yaniella sp.]MDN5817272.1 DUF2505 domain-containing protein [Yaniella sp.]MDN5837934.1 DUF2505 domain-containing protein [Yaniella sp.]